MIINKVWAMPSHKTFHIKPIQEFVDRYVTIHRGVWLDPFSGNTPFKYCCITNDLDHRTPSDYHMEALEFLKLHEDNSIDGVLFDPPYSSRQIAECYKNVGRDVHTEDTQSSFYGLRKKEIARILKPGGIVLCFGWNSGGIGKTNGFRMEEILLVSHGGPHNDTICTMEVKDGLHDKNR